MIDPELQRLGQRIRDARKRTRWRNSLTRLARDVLGISPTFLSQIERGCSKASPEVYLKLCEVLQLDSDEVLKMASQLDPSVLTAIRRRYDELAPILRLLIQMSSSDLQDLRELLEKVRSQSRQQHTMTFPSD